MKRRSQTAIAVAASLVFAAAAVFAQTGTSQSAPTPGVDHGPMMGHGMGRGMGHAMGHAMGHGPDAGEHGPMMGRGMGHGRGAGIHGSMAGPAAMLTRQDAGSAADMSLVLELLNNHTKIKRTVTKLPDGIRTATESDDPKVAQAINAHVASMSSRLKDGREFNIFSTTLPVIFDNADTIKSVVEVSDKGSIVTRTSTDPKIVAALQAHAGEVTELVQEGHVAMRRGMMSRMAMGSAGPRGAIGSSRPDTPAQSLQHAH